METGMVINEKDRFYRCEECGYTARVDSKVPAEEKPRCLEHGPMSERIDVEQFVESAGEEG